MRIEVRRMVLMFKKGFLIDVINLRSGKEGEREGWKVEGRIIKLVI